MIKNGDLVLVTNVNKRYGRHCFIGKVRKVASINDDGSVNIWRTQLSMSTTRFYPSEFVRVRNRREVLLDKAIAILTKIREAV